ncbi:MAG: DUF3726 domain-containing protein [Burkholderiales bacterium]
MNVAIPDTQPLAAVAERRSPDTVMRLARMGSFHPSRLSFMRSLLRRVKREQWRFERLLWEIDAKGVGRAVYCVHTARRSYSLVAFAHDLPDELRSDRVIATAWDATFTLFDGVPTRQDLVRLEANVPRQEAGRISDSELTLARANRSVRLWSYVIEQLAAGRQPDAAQVDAVGYLMRTTAVYGSGKFGAADRQAIMNRDELKAPFQAEMLTVWLIRAFTLDLVEHLARARGGAAAVVIEPGLRRHFGVGNSTGLGMAPFLLNHPVLLNRWMMAREEALARVRGVAQASEAACTAFGSALADARANALAWQSEHPIQSRKLDALRADLRRLDEHVGAGALTGQQPWNTLYRWAETALTLEGQEQLVSLMMEPYADLVDDLANQMDADETTPFTIHGTTRLARVRELLAAHYGWATSIDFTQAHSRARFWYVSEEKLEPRLGERARDDGTELELPLCEAEQVQQLLADLHDWNDAQSVAEFLLRFQRHRHVLRRVLSIEVNPYAEVRDNLIDAEMLPIDLLRCKLSFFGASRFDPRSDRWVRINMYLGAPFPHELCAAASPGMYRIEPGAGAAPTTPGAPLPHYTLAEIEALGRKAARGAGFSWGMAEEAGRAARWLTSFGLPGAEALAGLLVRNDGKPWAALYPLDLGHAWTSASGELCPLIAGASLLDRIAEPDHEAGFILGRIAYPLLVLPFVGRAAQRWQRRFEVCFSGVRACCLPEGLSFAGDMAQLAASETPGLTVRELAANEPVVAASATLTTPTSAARAVDADAWSALGRLAHRTYVAATDASRAGAGGRDQD